MQARWYTAKIIISVYNLVTTELQIHRSNPISQHDPFMHRTSESILEAILPFNIDSLTMRFYKLVVKIATQEAKSKNMFSKSAFRNVKSIFINQVPVLAFPQCPVSTIYSNKTPRGSQRTRILYRIAIFRDCECKNGGMKIKMTRQVERQKKTILVIPYALTRDLAHCNEFPHQKLTFPRT